MFHQVRFQLRLSLYDLVDPSRPQNVLVPYQFSTGPDRNKFIQTGRFQPYGMHRAGTAEHVNVDAQVASELTPSVGSQTPEPSGEIDELAADDEPVSNFIFLT